MSVLQPDYFPPGINNYVPAMQYAVDFDLGGRVRVSLGTPSTLDDDGIHAAIDGDALNTVKAADFAPASGGIGRIADSPFGRAVTISPSADPGATGMSIQVRGEDYLGQPMSETLTVPNASTADVVGKKAFKRVNEAEVTVAATNAVTADLGWGDVFGLPFKLGTYYGGAEGGTVVYHGTPTIAQPDETDPATATTGDPRGTYGPNDAADGSTEYIVEYTPDSSVNDDGNGGLHGIAHFHA